MSTNYRKIARHLAISKTDTEVSVQTVPLSLFLHKVFICNVSALVYSMRKHIPEVTGIPPAGAWYLL